MSDERSPGVSVVGTPGAKSRRLSLRQHGFALIIAPASSRMLTGTRIAGVTRVIARIYS